MPTPIFVTEAPNDRDLLQVLQSVGMNAISAPIPHGDAVFFGVWADSTACRVCIERKQLGDMVSCILSGRYLQQAATAYDAGFEHLVLIPEGTRRRDANNGLLMVPHGRGWTPTVPEIEYDRFENYLDQLSVYGGVLVKRSRDVTETAAYIRILHSMFQSAPEDHDSLHKIYSEPYPGPVSLFHPPSLLRRIAKELPGIGWKRSAEVEKSFGSVRDMIAADARRWTQIRGIGSKIAEGVVAAVSVNRK